jgi:hypothetical protein
MEELKNALAGALEWRLLVLWTLGIILPTAVATVPVWRVLSIALDKSPHASDIARRFDLLAFQDIAAAFERSGPALGGAASLATLLTFLLSPLLAGASLAAARADQPLGFAALLQEGIAWYGRMFRMLVVSLLPLAAVGAVASIAFHGAHKYGDRAIFESQATWALRGAWVVTLAVFVVVHATVEAGRAELGADDRLRSAWRAWFRGVRLMMRRPLSVVGLYLGVTLTSGLVAAVLLLIRLRLTGASVGGFFIGLVVTQLAVAALGWGRASRLFALARLARSGHR